ncbi:hypothetical protein [Turneriella parva]|uniref:Uncharacterized protein n=1 Tax=Turneriella parva (strain ATCC BAA-1111 / DSM 21527 / NCTC 11395 / H) TaxID=869212 RepID=I4B9K5_TURPD|nr:hypothetical protein [Turneriella parva]AFM13962.1 hypothetical protein Turpa_3324 [Turneriella parva DSM 21527]
MLNSARNQSPLDERQIEFCRIAWELLTGGQGIPLITDEAQLYASETRFDENRNAVILGANAYPGVGVSANAQLSMLTCLAHELAHAERFRMGFRRPFTQPDMLLDEAETSLHASFFTLELSETDRIHLVEDARDRLNLYLELKYAERGSVYES